MTYDAVITNISVYMAMDHCEFCCFCCPWQQEIIIFIQSHGQIYIEILLSIKGQNYGN